MLLQIVKENELIKIDGSIADFHRSHPRIKRSAVVHLVPLTFSDKFKEEELKSSSNLASLGSDRQSALVKLKNIYGEWAPFIRSPQSYSAEQITKQARLTKAKYKLREGCIPPSLSRLTP